MIALEEVNTEIGTLLLRHGAPLGADEISLDLRKRLDDWKALEASSRKTQLDRNTRNSSPQPFYVQSREVIQLTRKVDEQTQLIQRLDWRLTQLEQTNAMQQELIEELHRKLTNSDQEIQRLQQIESLTSSQQKVKESNYYSMQ